MKKRVCPPAFHPAAFLALLILLLLSPWPARAGEAEQPAATVVAVRGEVRAVSVNGETRPLAVKSPVHNEDTIQTGKGGRIQILFTDNTIYSLGQNSEMKIIDYKWQPEEKSGVLKTKVKEGVFRVMGGAITKTSPQNFTTETPAATIGIRGSMYAGTVTPSSLSVIFQGGKGIAVTNPFGAVEISKPGHGTSVKLNSAPEPPRKLSEKDMAVFSTELPAEDEEGEQQPPAEGDEEKEVAPAADESAAAPATIETAAATAATETTVPVIELPPPNETAPAIDPASETTLVPADGISGYFGALTGVSTFPNGPTDPINDMLWMEINWHSGRVLGRLKSKDGSPSAFFIGKVGSNGLIEVDILGSNMTPPPPGTTFPGVITAISGSGSGVISGTGFDLFTFTGSGNTYDLKPDDQPRHAEWSIQGTAGKEIQEEDDGVSPRGTVSWKGFVVGVSEDMADVDSDRRLFMNSDQNDFAFIVDKDNGALNGALSAADVNGSNSRLITIDLGGSLPSAFVLEDNFAAVLGCVSGDCIYSGPATPAGLKQYGNFLISAAPEVNILGDYVTWGYWEIAYTDPASGAPYHTHVPGSRWIAGEPTPVDEVDNLTAASFTGHYAGMALASRVDPAAPRQVEDLRGTVDLSVDFGHIQDADAVRGVIDLGEIRFNVGSGAAGNASANGFSNTVSGVSGPTGTLPGSQFNGGFYGPGARNIAGNFHAPTGSGVSYTGIYGGTR
ncbi:MAG: FecR domain-containing protein [Deltaproteobacteria bacterium]|nr:FecR domain-containing protein [Deltaproteobacteria bacterium]